MMGFDTGNPLIRQDLKEVLMSDALVRYNRDGKPLTKEEQVELLTERLASASSVSVANRAVAEVFPITAIPAHVKEVLESLSAHYKSADDARRAAKESARQLAELIVPEDVVE